MELKITTANFLKVLHVLSWIIFIGLCIEVGGILFNAFFTIVINPIAAKNFWGEIDLSSLLNFDKVYFIVQTLLMSIVAILKAILFYLIVKFLYDKKLNLAQPFNIEINKFILTMSYLAIGISIFSFWGAKHNHWFLEKGIIMPDDSSMGFSGADVWLFMGIILLVIAQIFKRGIEIQSENELTI
jgi:hypothetical protein